ncbi:hypothetical protein HYC85_027328 [Camellia sinensis]|uniref:CCDC93 coiled-coil domain-containing protein n=1 Tax=Camellia sinensis TaxID=4442 RepID=A0A7J7G664_CAMSI|nr:hypothetical protein HYC85_027328 [Camellia sinensis]
MVTCTENSIEEEEHAFVQLQEELKNAGSSIDTLNTNLEQLALEMQESEHKSNCNAKYSKLQAEELAVKLREIVLLKRQLDDMPSQELIYEVENTLKSDLSSRSVRLCFDLRSIIPLSLLAGASLKMVTCTENSIEEEEHAFVQLQEELKNVGSSIDTLNTNLEQLNQRKANCLNKMQHLQERISREGTTDVVQRLLSLSQSLKALEMQESEHKSNCNAKYSKLQAEVNELENIISCGNDDANLSHGINHSLYNSLERLNSAKRELAVKLREIVLLKRQLDDVPLQEELIQYEHRFSELYVHIQEKLRQTRELYATFNAMLEIKDLMLKETSLLNSISSQV